MTDDELVILTIAGDGKSMLAIGRWKPAVESLTCSRPFFLKNSLATCAREGERGRGAETWERGKERYARREGEERGKMVAGEGAQ